jgi:hypothetical protein
VPRKNGTDSSSLKYTGGTTRVRALGHTLWPYKRGLPFRTPPPQERNSLYATNKHLESRPRRTDSWPPSVGM